MKSLRFLFCFFLLGAVCVCNGNDRANQYRAFKKVEAEARNECLNYHNLATHERADIASRMNDLADLYNRVGDVASKVAVAAGAGNRKEISDLYPTLTLLMDQTNRLKKEIMDLKQEEKLSKNSPPPRGQELAGGGVELGDYGEYVKTPDDVQRWLKEDDRK